VKEAAANGYRKAAVWEPVETGFPPKIEILNKAQVLHFSTASRAAAPRPVGQTP